MLRDGTRRKKWAPLLLLAAGVGAILAIDSKLPRTRSVVLDLGPAAREITDIELTWTRAGAPASEEAAVTTRWHFTARAAPERLRFEARLAAGAWDVEATVERHERPETTRWPYRVNLEGSTLLGQNSRGDQAVVLPIRDALR